MSKPLDRRICAGVRLAFSGVVVICGIACAPAVRVAPLPPQWCAASTSTPGRVTACASADSESVADDRAFARIARQLSQEVAVRETMTSGEETQRDVNGRRVARSFSTYSEDVQAVALARLLGARVEQRAQVGSTYYALASLDLRQVTRRVSVATDEALAHAARGDVVRALGSCREARQQARLLPVLFAEVDANVGRCQILSEALYERLSVTAVADTLLRIHYEGRPVARLRLQVRRAGVATSSSILGESDELGFVHRARPFPMVGGGSLHEEFDVVWDGLDDHLESRPYRARTQMRTEFPGRSVSVTVTGDLPPDDEAKLLAALRREFGEGGRSSSPDAIWVVKLSARIRHEESALSGVRAASVTISWQLVRVGSGAATAQGGVVDQRAVGITDSDARTSVILRSAVSVAASLERALAQAERQ